MRFIPEYTGRLLAEVELQFNGYPVNLSLSRNPPGRSAGWCFAGAPRGYADLATAVDALTAAVENAPAPTNLLPPSYLQFTGPEERREAPGVAPFCEKFIIRKEHDGDEPGTARQMLYNVYMEQAAANAREVVATSYASSRKAEDLAQEFLTHSIARHNGMLVREKIKTRGTTHDFQY